MNKPEVEHSPHYTVFYVVSRMKGVADLIPDLLMLQAVITVTKNTYKLVKDKTNF